MKTPDSMLDTCLCWLTETSVYRFRLNGLKRQLHHLQHLFSGDSEVLNQYNLVMQGIQTAVHELHLTESKLVYTTKKHAHSISCDVDEDTRYLLLNEEELYENMKYFYTLFIELQRTVNHFLTEKIAPNAPTKVIQLRHVQRQKTTYPPYRVSNLLSAH